MLQRLFHVNICVRDMERSIAFYERLGFKKVNDFVLEGGDVGEALGLADVKKLRGVFMRLGDDETAPVIDLVQFLEPAPRGEPYPTLNNIGICRIAFSVEDIDKATATLEEMGVEFVAPMKKVTGVGDAEIGVVCFKDPDGTVLELLSGM